MKNFTERMRCVGVKFIKFIENISWYISIIFNRLNLIKGCIIFVVGFVSRVLVNYFWDVNVFVDYLNSISLGYYGFMAIFVVLVNELFSYIDLKLLPKISMDVFSISSFRMGISGIISNIGNKGKVPISGDLGLDKVLDKSNKVKVSGVLLMGDRDGISSGVRDKGVYNSENNSRNGNTSNVSSKSRIVPFVLGKECVKDVLGENDMTHPSCRNHEYKRRKITSSLISAKYSLDSESSIDPRIYRGGPGAPKISGLSTPETMSPLFPPSEVNNSYNSYRPSYKSFTSEEYRDIHIRGRQKDIIASIEKKLHEDKQDFSKPIRSLSDPIKTSPKKEFSKPNRSYSDPIKTSRGRILSDSIKTSPKKVFSKFKDYVDGPGYVEPVPPTRVKVERTSAAIKGLYGYEQSENNSPELKSYKKGGYYKKGSKI